MRLLLSDRGGGGIEEKKSVIQKLLKYYQLFLLIDYVYRLSKYST
jgi:hypothetical protein